MRENMKFIFYFLCCVACLKSYASEEKLSFSKEYVVNCKKVDVYTVIYDTMKKESENLDGKFYALVYDCWEKTNTKNAHLHFFFSDKRPKVVPESSCALYDPSTKITHMEWILPCEEYFDFFLRIQDFMSYRMIESIKRFKDGTLK